MSELDYFIVVVVVVSSLFSVVRGFLKEALSLVIWVLAGAVAFTLSPYFSSFVPGFVDSPTVRLGAVALVLFLCTLFAGGIVSQWIYKAAAGVGLSGTDRLLGVLFGVARGVVILTVLVMLASLTALPQEHWWQTSLLIEYFVSAAVWMQPYLPEDLIHYLSFEYF